MKNKISFLPQFALLLKVVRLHSISTAVYFLNTFGIQSLISTEIKQTDIDFKDYGISICSADTVGQTENRYRITFWLREWLQKEFVFFMIPENLHTSTYKYLVVGKASGFLYLNHQGQPTARQQSTESGTSFVLQLCVPLAICITFIISLTWIYRREGDGGWCLRNASLPY